MDELDALRGFRASLAIPDTAVRERIAERLSRAPRAHSRRRRAALAIVLAATTLVLVAISGAADGVLSTIGVTRDATHPIPAGGADATTPYLLGRSYHDKLGAVHRLAAIGSGFPDAVSGPSGQIIYTARTADFNHPDLRLFDPTTGNDELLAASAASPAWRRDGTLAYAARTPADPTKIPDFNVILEVRPSPTAPAVPWSTEATGYEPIAWAGNTLIASTFATDDRGLRTLVALDGPGTARMLATGALIAISPDGTQLLVAKDAAPDGIPSSPNLELVDLASGAVTRTLDLRQVTPPGLTTGQILPGGAGDWLDNRVVYPAPAGAVILDARNDTLALVKVAQFTGDDGLRGAEYHEARFTGTTANQIIERAVVLPPSGHGGQMLPSALVCDLTAIKCTRGAVAENTTEPLTLVYNPSRPA
jgi:hypothetical protein